MYCLLVGFNCFMFHVFVHTRSSVNSLLQSIMLTPFSNDFALRSSDCGSSGTRKESVNMKIGFWKRSTKALTTVTQRTKSQVVTNGSHARSGARTRSESESLQVMTSLLQSVSPLTLLRQPWNIPFPMMVLRTSLWNFTYVCMGIDVIAVNHCIDFGGCPKNV